MKKEKIQKEKREREKKNRKGDCEQMKKKREGKEISENLKKK